jgi:hypothetical protein
MVEYRHTINKNMISCLYFFAKKDGVISFSWLDGEFTFNQISNMQKLKYWGLIAKCSDDDQIRQGGKWELTDHGYRFLSGQEQISKSVWTYRNDVQRFDGPKMTIDHFGYEPYRRSADYVNDQVTFGTAIL